MTDLRTYGEPGDACLDLAADPNGSVRGPPQRAVDVPGLLHAGVVRVRPRQHLVVGRFCRGGEEQLPAAWPEWSRELRVVQAGTKRRRSRLLVRGRWEDVGLALRQAARDP